MQWLVQGQTTYVNTHVYTYFDSTETVKTPAWIGHIAESCQCSAKKAWFCLHQRCLARSTLCMITYLSWIDALMSSWELLDCYVTEWPFIWFPVKTDECSNGKKQRRGIRTPVIKMKLSPLEMLVSGIFGYRTSKLQCSSWRTSLQLCKWSYWKCQQKMKLFFRGGPIKRQHS